LTCVLFVLAFLALSGVAGAHGKTWEVVAGGLDNPRGIDVGPWGSIYVTEAGRGGAGPCITGPEGLPLCAGASGAVTKVWHGHQRRVVSGLPSIAGVDGSQALGPQDIALRRFGGAYLVVGLGADPARRAELGELGPGFGQLYKLSPRGHIRAVADIAGFEAAENPDGGEPDSNPNSVLTRRGRTLVVDAGGNSLLDVSRHGGISTLAVFPFRDVPAPPGIPDLPPVIPMQPVPTSVVVGPDGAYYVSELTGFPFPPGAARIYRVVPGAEPEVYAEGFTNVTDLAYGPDGSLYVLEIATNGLLSEDPTGALIRVRPDGSREDDRQRGPGDAHRPGGRASGRVVRLEPGNVRRPG
jgi:hypothetical protein